MYEQFCTFSILLFLLHVMRRKHVFMEYNATSQRELVGKTFLLFLGRLWKFLWLTETAGVYC